MATFKNYFWTCQLSGGIALMATMGAQGWNAAFYGTFWTNLYYAVLWGIGGFLVAVPISMLIALGLYLRENRRIRRQSSPPRSN